MKKIISLIICSILLIGIIIPAYATNVDQIKPDTNVIFVGITNEEVPAPDNFYTRYNNDASLVVVFPYYRENNTYLTPAYSEEQTHESNSDPVATEDENTNEDVPSTPDEEQSIDYNIDHEKLIEEIFILVNKVRKENGIPELTYGKEIQDVADLRAREASESFSHTRPDGSSCHDAIKLEYYATGENLLMADKEIATAENMMKTWMKSEGHRANILLKDFTEIAIGIYEKDDVVYATQIFLG